MTAETTDIRFDCTQCGQRLVVEAAAAGVASNCPNCHAEVVVPLSSVVGEETTPLRALKGRRRAAAAGQSAEASRSSEVAADSAGRREEVVAASLRTAELERELGLASEEQGRLHHQLKAATDECERLKASVTHAQAELKTFQAERQQAKVDLSNVRQRLATVELQLESRERELADLHETATEWQALANSTAAELDEERERHAVTVAELEQTRGAFATADGQLFAAGATITELTAEAEQTNRALSEALERLVGADEVAQRLTQAEADLQAAQAALLRADEENRALTARCAQLRSASDELHRDLQATDSGRELVALRSRLSTAETERDQTATRLAATEHEAKTLRDAEVRLRAELDDTRRQRDETRIRLEAAAESQVAKDNEVLRGIINRQNNELAQHHREIVRLKRARFTLKIIYAIFALGLLGVVALALKVLPPVLDLF